MVQTIKDLFAMWETRVRSLDQEDPLEKGMSTHSSILAWRIRSTEEPGGDPSPWGRTELYTTEQLTHTKFSLAGSFRGFFSFSFFLLCFVFKVLGFSKCLIYTTIFFKAAQE